MKTSKIPVILCPLFIIASLLTAPVPTLAQGVQCVETNGQKFLLPPDTDGGLDVKDSVANVVLADDFFCNITGPVSDIHIWGSWLSDQTGAITNFWLGIYSDIPAVTNFSSGQVIPSRPGTLLWQQSFGPGQFATSLYTTGSETFLDPTVPIFTGTDTEAWYYCFYPTNPFIQQGTTTAPTNYWLAAYAQVNGQFGSGAPDTYGWKTAVYPYNDAAVWGNLAANGIPLGNWQSMTNTQTGQPINLSFKLNTTTNPPPPPPPVRCDDTNGVKYVQWPNIDNGRDVWDSGPWSLADDFLCTQTGPVNSIHLWGSWLNDQVQTNTLIFNLAIYSDVPASNSPTGQQITPSHPGNLLWQEKFGPGQYNESFWSYGQEAFFDPGSFTIMGPDSQVWYYCFYPTNPFVQQGTAAVPTIYWLFAYAMGPSQFGWKTTTQVQFDTSVYTPWTGAVPSNPVWTPIQQTSTNGPLDLAFIIATITNPPPPVTCTLTNAIKYEQPPKLTGGYDVANDTYALADDFICSNRAPISDIHLWGSWLNSQAITNTLIFWLGIYNDVPVGPNNTYSHPGTNLLWQQWFGPGQYAETFWGIGQETFFDPSLQFAPSPETNVWFYCFYPTNPFVQQGTPTAPTNYWLASYAQLPAGIPYQFGRKTTFAVQNDISVHTPWPGVPPVGVTWTPTTFTNGAPLDLSFLLTAPYCGPLNIRYLDNSNKVVLTWSSGALQISTAANLMTTNVQGTYIDIPGATSPYTNPTALPASFFRLRCY